MREETNNIDPQLYATTADSGVVYQTYEPLLIQGNDGSDVYILVEDVSVNDDASVASFTLKEGVKFHSGDTLTSEDVEYSLSRCEFSPIAGTMFQVAQIEVIDDLHFNMIFPMAEVGYNYYALAAYIPTVLIVNKSFCEGILATKDDNLGYNEDGTGAYYFADKAGNGDITLKKFEDYHGEVSIDTINMKLVTGSAELAFESGDLDGAVYGAANYEIIKDVKGVTGYQQAVNHTGFMSLNCAEGKATSDKRVREAIANLLNREDIAKVATSDAGTAAYNMANPVVTYYDDCCNHFAGDEKSANKLLADAGYDENNKCKLVLITVAQMAEWSAAAEIVKENLEKANFEVSIEAIDSTDRFFTGDYDIGVIGIGLTTSFVGYSALFDMTSGLNLAMIDGSEAEEVLATFAGATDEEGTHAAMKAVVDSLAYIPLFYSVESFAFDENLNVGTFYTGISAQFYKDFSWK